MEHSNRPDFDLEQEAIDWAELNKWIVVRDATVLIFLLALVSAMIYISQIG